MATPEKLYRPFIERYIRTEQQLNREVNRLFGDKVHNFSQLDNRFKQLSPQRLITLQSKQLVTSTNQLNQAMIAAFEKNRQRFIGSLRTLEALNPLKIMDRGYSITYKDGQVIKSIDEVQKGDTIAVTLPDGQIDAIVQQAVSKEGVK